MAGVPPVTLSAALSAKAQQAALIMLAQDNLSHYPPRTWKCWGKTGNMSASNSDLALGTTQAANGAYNGNFGPWAVDLYMEDPGVLDVGHCFWVLSPYVRVVGTGDAGRLQDPWQWQKGYCCKAPAAQGFCSSTAACSKDSYW
jgi:hypothetical protein